MINNFSEKKEKKGISVICVSKDREENLKKALKSWLFHKEIDEIILVDWDSNRPLKRYLNKYFKDKRIIYIKVLNQPRWILSKAYNLASRFASKDKILKLDADIVLNKDFFKHHKLKKGFYYRGNWKIARNKNEMHLSGTAFIYKRDFFEVGGYNEYIDSYGYDDTDLYARLNSIGLKSKNFILDDLFHIPHNKRLRIKHQPGVKNLTIENENNNFKSKALLWSKKNKMEKYLIEMHDDEYIAHKINPNLKILDNLKNLYPIKYIRFILLKVAYHTDRNIGKIGIRIKGISPKTYSILKKIKNYF
jgi:predicted glycosyltransferase involved in capsule biosynthesis